MSTWTDKEYRRLLDERGPTYGVEQCALLLRGVVAMLDFQVLRERPGLSERERQIETARRLYFSDKGAQRLLDLVAERS